MTSQLTIHTGPAASGKTTRLLELYLEQMQAARRRGTPGRLMWISPNQLAKAEIEAALSERAGDVLLAPNVYTFSKFAEKILQASPKPIRQISPTAARRLLRTIIDRLASDGELSHFRTVTRTAGFLDLVAGLIAELKRDEIWPEDFQAACRARGAGPKDEQLARIYAEYQQQLLAHDLYDAEGRFWWAREMLAQGHRRPFENLECVVVDGFADFTGTQIAILQLLTGWIEQLHVSLPVETPLVRADLFAKSNAAVAQLKRLRRAGCQVKTAPVKLRGRAISSTLETIRNHLFDNPRQIVPAAAGPDLQVLAAMGTRAEQRAVARRVKSLLLEGVPPEEIVVAIRSGATSDARDWRRAFLEAGIPTWCDQGAELRDQPLVRAALSLIELESQEWSFTQLMELLDSNYFRPQWPELANTWLIRQTDYQLRRHKLYRSRRAMLDTLDRAAEREQQDETSPATSIAKVARLLRKLSDTLEPLRKRGTLAEWSQRLAAIVRELGMIPPAPQNPEAHPLDVAERDAWDKFVGILFDAAQADETFADPPRTFDLAGFRDELREILASQSLPEQHSAAGRIKIIDVTQARSLSIPYLFVVGLTEEAFPRAQTDESLYSESERRELNSHGLTLGHGATRQQDELLLFYGLVTSFRRQLTLSYPDSDQRGLPRFPSSYLQTLCELFTPETLAPQPVGQLDPVPELNDTLSDGDLRLVAIEQARHGAAGLFLTGATDVQTRPAFRNVLAAARAAVARFHRPGFSAYEGQLLNTTNLRRLQAAFPADYQFSVTQLEQYAACPFRFLAEKVLGVRALDDPEASSDPQRRGSVVHSVLSRLHTELKSPDAVDEIKVRFAELVEAEFQQVSAGTPLAQVLLNIEQQLLQEWAEEYAHQSEGYQQKTKDLWHSPPQIQHLEFAFGAPYGTDPESATVPPLTIGTGDELVQLCGRIDRVDVGLSDGKPGFLLIDYKTGEPPQFNIKKVQAGSSLQLVVYLIALKRLGVVGTDVRPLQMGYWSIKEDGFVKGLTKQGGPRGIKPFDDKTIQDLENLIDEIIPKLVARLRQGVFAVASEDPNCTAYCDFRTGCRIAEVRSVKERLQKQLSPLVEERSEPGEPEDKE